MQMVADVCTPRVLACPLNLESIGKARWITGVLQGRCLMMQKWKLSCSFLLTFPKVAFHSPCCNHKRHSGLLFFKSWQKPDVPAKLYDVVRKKICSMYIPLSQSHNTGQCCIPLVGMFVLPRWPISIFCDYNIISLKR